MTLKRNMCVLSSHTCGACFAKWTGQSWKETYEGILPLKMWTLVLNKSFQLCIEGRYDDYGIDLVICVPVKKRVNSRWVANERTLIKLHGPLFSKDLPDFVVARFSDGIPENWKVVAEKWVDFVGHGENSSFSFNLNDTFTSDSTRGSRNRRTLGGGRAGSQRRTPAAAKHPSSDSAFQSIRGSSATPSNWVSPSPWLPPHKVKEITQWMNRSPVTPLIPPDPLTGLDSEPRDGGSIIDLHLDGLPSAGARTTASSSSLRLSAASRQRQLSVSNVAVPSRQKNNAIVQSTPLTGTQDIRPSANPLNLSMTMSSISHMDLSSGMSSLESVVPQDDLFRKPMLDAHGIETSVSTRSESKKTVGSPKRVSKPTLSTKPVEAPGAEIGRMENSSRSRPLRKHSPQKIERWRPILGVDGNVKLQGYLVLRGDMTAGQILTTNSVVEWSGSKVTTCDKREYELIGDMYDPSGKISASLRMKLKKAVKCCDIQEALQETQALRDRSDWGAEYDIFYHDSTNPEKSSSSPAGAETPHSGGGGGGSSGSSSTSSTSSSTRRNKAASSSSSGAVATPGRRSRAPQPFFSPLPFDSPSSSSGQESPVRKSLRLSRKRNDSDSDYEYVPNRSYNSNNNNKKLRRQEQQQKQKKNSDTSSGRVLLRATPAAKTDDYVMHVSPSRIKVSYLSKAKTPAAANNNNKQQQEDTLSVRCRPQTTVSTGLRSRTPRCPAKLSCDSCCGPSSSDAQSAPTTPTTRTHRATAAAAAAAAASAKKQNNKNPKKRSKMGSGSVDRNLRGTLGKTRLQTLNKSPRLLISPLDMNKLKNRGRGSCTKKGSGGGGRGGTGAGKVTCSKKLFTTSETSETNTRKTRTMKKTKSKDASQPKTSTLVNEDKDEEDEEEAEDKDVTRGRQRVLRKTTEVEKMTNARAKEKKKQTNQKRKKNRVTDEEEEKEEQEEEEEKKKNVKTGTKTATKAQTDHKTGRQKTRSATLPLAAPAAPRELVDVSLEEEEEEEDKEDNASVCSNASDISVGPSASVIFAMNAAAVEAAGGLEGEDGRQRAPRTLRERRKRDAALKRMKELVDEMESRGGASRRRGGGDGARTAVADDDDDDPVAQLINSKPFQPLPQDWCDHSKWMRQGGRKHRRPSSSDGTASPSRSALSSDGGHEDATSSVATPQLLMRRPDPKQVQSYLQRLRAMNSKPHRPTRRVRADRQFQLPDIDYSQAFRNESSSDSGSESPVDSDWEG